MSSASSAVTYTSEPREYFGEPTRSYQMEDEDEHEPMFIQPHDPDFMPEPIYPEYIPLEDEHILSAEEQPLPPVVSPTAESPGYVAESDPEEDPEEYEDDETEDGPVDYPMDGRDDGDDDDDDSSGDDADDEDNDEEEEEHLAPADSAIVIPTNELAAISFPLEAEVERLLAMPTPSPSPLALLSPPSARERLARCMAPAALPSPPLPPPLHMPPPVDRRDDIPETEMPPRKRLCLSTLGSRYEVEESSTARLTGGQEIKYGFISTLDAKARRRGIKEVRYGIRDTWVDPIKTVPEIEPMTVGELTGTVPTPCPDLPMCVCPNPTWPFPYFSLDDIRLIPDGEETLALERESRSKLNKDLVRPYNYTTLNSLYEIFKPPTQEYETQLAHANEIRRKMWRKSFVKSKPNIYKNVRFLPVSKSISKSRQAYNVMTNNINNFKEIVDNAWIKHSKDQFHAPTAQDMEILIQTCLMPLAIKTRSDSLKFVHEFKQEIRVDLKYIETLEKEIDELESDKAEFSDMYDVILKECVSKDVMCSYLQSLSYLDAKKCG
nr:hypothetical protein [Tanacetum cinerariifolium]